MAELAGFQIMTESAVRRAQWHLAAPLAPSMSTATMEATAVAAVVVARQSELVAPEAMVVSTAKQGPKSARITNLRSRLTVFPGNGAAVVVVAVHPAKQTNRG
jgi:hypothetical protein